MNGAPDVPNPQEQLDIPGLSVPLPWSPPAAAPTAPPAVAPLLAPPQTWSSDWSGFLPAADASLLQVCERLWGANACNLVAPPVLSREDP